MGVGGPRLEREKPCPGRMPSAHGGGQGPGASHRLGRCFCPGAAAVLNTLARPTRSRPPLIPEAEAATSGEGKEAHLLSSVCRSVGSNGPWARHSFPASSGHSLICSLVYPDAPKCRWTLLGTR